MCIHPLHASLDLGRADPERWIPKIACKSIIGNSAACEHHMNIFVLSETVRRSAPPSTIPFWTQLHQRNKGKNGAKKIQQTGTGLYQSLGDPGK